LGFGTLATVMQKRHNVKPQKPLKCQTLKTYRNVQPCDAVIPNYPFGSDLIFKFSFSSHSVTTWQI